MQSISLNIKIPVARTSGSSAARGPRYVSVNTQSAAIAVNGAAPAVIDLAAGSPACSTPAGGGRTCTLTLTAPVGSDRFAETLYATTDGTGPALSQSATTATIVAGTANVVNLALDGVIATLDLSLANAAPSAGTPANIGLTVTAADASGAAIIGANPFSNSVALSDSDTSGLTTLSKTVLNSPADAANITIAYNGQPLTKAVFGAAASGVAAKSVTLTPGPVLFNDYTTFGYDNARDVFNPNSAAITPALLPKLHLAWQASLGDFNTQTQPILATEVPGHAGVLFMGGGSGYMYAYDATNGNQIWKANLGQETYTCDGTSTAYFGVGGTAAYDPASASLYVVGNSDVDGKTNKVANVLANNVLYRLDALTGKILGKVNFAPAAVGPSEINFSHTAVTIHGGIAYVGTSSTCDISSWRGRIAAVNVPSMTLAATFFPVSSPQAAPGGGQQYWGGGGIWGWGGVSLDPSGNVLTGVGNADNNSAAQISAPFVQAPSEYAGYAESLLEVGADLSTVIASNHPIAPSIYGGAAYDLDVQGTPLVFTPTGCGTMVAVQAKSGELSVYDESRLNAGAPAAQFQMAATTSDDTYLGDPAYSPANNLVYANVASNTDASLFGPGLIAIDPGCGNPAVAWHASFGVDATSADIPQSVPAASAGGVVFAGSVVGSGGAVWAVDASTGSVLNGGTPLLQTSGNLRMPATIDGSWVFVLDNSGNIYGLTIDSSYRAIAATRRADDARQRRVWKRARRG